MNPDSATTVTEVDKKSATNNTIVISGIGTISALGARHEQSRHAYEQSDASCAVRRVFAGREAAVAPITAEGEERLSDLTRVHHELAEVDRSVQLACVAALDAVASAGWELGGDGPPLAGTGVNIGSSRGATELWEQYASAAGAGEKLSPLASPMTTLGNISSWVAHTIGASGAAFSHSVTCSSGLFAVLNGIAWLRAGMIDRFIAGGSEAPLTKFTVQQMRALRIYSEDRSSFPCRPLARNYGASGLILGEGAAVVALERGEDYEQRIAANVPAGSGERGVIERNAFEIVGVGYAQETISSPSGISRDGSALGAAMQMALAELPIGEAVDAIVLHAPGTKQGDHAELAAVEKLFTSRGTELPALLSNKWRIGHTFGAAGVMNLEYALLLLNGLPDRELPYETVCARPLPPGVSSVMVNAAGFGGNAVSIVVRRFRR